MAPAALFLIDDADLNLLAGLFAQIDNDRLKLFGVVPARFEKDAAMIGHIDQFDPRLGYMLHPADTRKLAQRWLATNGALVSVPVASSPITSNPPIQYSP